MKARTETRDVKPDSSQWATWEEHDRGLTPSQRLARVAARYKQHNDAVERRLRERGKQ